MNKIGSTLGGFTVGAVVGAGVLAVIKNGERVFLPTKRQVKRAANKTINKMENVVDTAKNIM